MLLEREVSTLVDVTANDDVPKHTVTHSIAHSIVQPEKTDLEMPASIWTMMFAGYALFFIGLIVATAHDTGTMFVIVISILYALLYFGVASVLFNQNRPEKTSLFARGLGPLATHTGPMDKGAVIGQVLTIPACLALFGIAMAAFRIVIFG